MTLDPTTVMVMTGVVTTTVGVVFISDVLRRHSEGAGRLWALSFLAGMLTIVCYAAASAYPGAWGAIALGNASFVVVPGVVWVGAARYNGIGVARAAWIVLFGAIATFLAVALDTDPTDPWAGVEVMFPVTAAFCFAAAASARRAPLRTSPAATGLALMMAIAGGYYMGRLITFLALGPQATAFEVPFGSTTASVVTVVVTIVTASVLSVILSEQRTLTEARGGEALILAEDGVYDASSFGVLAHELAGRARQRGDEVAVISVRMDDLSRIATAFGSVEAEELRAMWRAATRGAAPSEAIVGVDPDGGLSVALAPTSVTRARAVAVQIRRAVHDEVMAAGMSVVPTVRVGVAMVIDDVDAATAIISARTDADADRNA